MSCCPLRYASKSIRNLKYLHSTSALLEPLWFPYPRWFALASSRPYHTERKRGQDHRPLFQKRSRETEYAVKASYTASRHYSLSRATFAESLKKFSPASINARFDRQKSSAENQRTVLDGQVVIRKVVPATVWKTEEKIPGQRALARRAHFARQLDSDAIISLLQSLPDSSPEPTGTVPHVVLSTPACEELLPPPKRENTWLHHEGSGCIVKLRQNRLEFHGSDRAAEIACHHFSDILNFTRSQAHLDWSRRNRHGSYSPLNGLKRPPVWTVRSFLDYVIFVTRTRFRRSACRGIYPVTGSHNKAVFEILENIFTDPVSRPYASTEALNVALSFCRRHPESPSVGARIWEAMKTIGLNPDIDCFNQEIGRCLVDKNLNRFRHIIDEMKDLGIPPNSTTWAVVLSYTDRAVSRARIDRLAGRSGDRANLVLATAEKEIQCHIGFEGGIRIFMQKMKAKFGRDWLTSRVLKSLLKVSRTPHANVNLISEILSVLQEKAKMSLVDSKCILELIRVSVKSGNLEDAVQLSKLKALSEIADLPQEIIDMMFHLAWRRKCFNMCRFFWFVGATSGRITREMQRLVEDSLKTNVSKIEDPIEASWQLLAGKIIIGTNLNTAGFQKIFPILSKGQMKTTPVEWLCNWVPANEERHEQFQLSQLLVERDLQAYRFFERLRRHEFLRWVERAKKVDDDWISTRAIQTISPRQLLAQSLQIPLTKRDVILQRSDSQGDGTPNRRWFVVNDHKLDYHTLKYSESEEEATATPEGQSKDQDEISAAKLSDTIPQDMVQSPEQFFQAFASSKC